MGVQATIIPLPPMSHPLPLYSPTTVQLLQCQLGPPSLSQEAKCSRKSARMALPRLK